MMSILKKIFSKHIPNRVKCIVWDIDGTLYDTSETIFHRMKQITIQYIHEYTRLPTKQIIEHIQSENSDHKTLGDIVTNDYHLPAYKLALLVEHQIHKSIYVQKNIRMVNLIEEVLSSYTHCVLSNSSRINVITCLQKIGFNPTIFKTILTLDELRNKHKPDPYSFNQIISKTKESPESHMMVGDSLIHDIYPASELGFYTCYINKYNNRNFDKRKVNININHALELTFRS